MERNTTRNWATLKFLEIFDLIRFRDKIELTVYEMHIREKMISADFSADEILLFQWSNLIIINWASAFPMM